MKISKLGRPRSFDAGEALDRALEVFWRSGYEGASLSDLTEAMGITRPSLYAAYGNKEELFRKALDRYALRSAAVFSALEEVPARESVRRFLTASVNGSCANGQSKGCLLVKGALSCSQENDHMSKELARRRQCGEDLLRDRLIRAKEEGELPASADPADLARYYSTVLYGLSVQAAGGAPVEDLLKVVDAAMRVWSSQA